MKATAECTVGDEISRFPQLAAIDDPQERERRAKDLLTRVRTAAEQPAAEAQQEFERCQKANEGLEKIRDDSRRQGHDLRGLLDDHGETSRKHVETARQAF